MNPALRLLLVGALALAPACVDRPALGDTEAQGDTTGTTGDVTAAPTTTTTAPTSTGGPEGCGYTVPYDIPILVPRVMLVVDQSPAMLDPWDHDLDPQTPDVPRWSSVHDELTSFIATLALYADVGLVVYPGAGATDMDSGQACTFAADLDVIAPGPDAPVLFDALAPANAALVGAAPLRDALTAALAALGPADGPPRNLVLVANSAPNCAAAAPDTATLLESLDPGVLDLAPGLVSQGIGLFVVGVGAASDATPIAPDKRPDGVAVADYLAELAAATGQKLLNPQSVPELADAFDDLIGDPPIKNCEVLVDPPPAPDQHVSEVRVGGATVPGPAADCADPWSWQSVDAETIWLCPAACDALFTSGTIEIDVVCEPA